MESNSHRRTRRGLDITGPGRHARRVTGPDWQRLASYVVRRRQECDLPTTRALARATGITEKTIGNLEKGRLVSRDTLAAVERVLGWAPGSCAAILAGGEPRLEAGADVDPEAAAARAQIIAMSAEQLAETHRVILQLSGQSIADEWLQSAMELRRQATVGGAHSPHKTRREVG